MWARILHHEGQQIVVMLNEGDRGPFQIQIYLAPEAVSIVDYAGARNDELCEKLLETITYTKAMDLVLRAAPRGYVRLDHE